MTERQFEAMVRQYERLVYTVCCRLVRDRQIAEDLAQETFLSAWQHRADCPAQSEKAWLCRIAVNKAKDHLKSAYNRRVTACEAPGETLCAQTAPDVGAVCELRDAARRAAQSIDALNEPYRAVSLLYFGREMSADDIAAQLGRMPKTVQTQLYRARKKLQQTLAAPC